MAVLNRLSLAQAAKIIGISRSTLYHYIHVHKLFVVRGDDGVLYLDTALLMRIKEELRGVDDMEPAFMPWIAEVKGRTD